MNRYEGFFINIGGILLGPAAEILMVDRADCSIVYVKGKFISLDLLVIMGSGFCGWVGETILPPYKRVGIFWDVFRTQLFYFIPDLGRG